MAGFIFFHVNYPTHVVSACFIMSHVDGFIMLVFALKTQSFWLMAAWTSLKLKLWKNVAAIGLGEDVSDFGHEWWWRALGKGNDMFISIKYWRDSTLDIAWIWRLDILMDSNGSCGLKSESWTNEKMILAWTKIIGPTRGTWFFGYFLLQIWSNFHCGVASCNKPKKLAPILVHYQQPA